MSKRRRSRSPTADKGTSPVQSQLAWFEDGNIILQAENTQFKVHRGVLAKHSPVFADLFQVPQPTNEPVVDGCPVVQIPDSAGDVADMLCCLYGDNDAMREDGLLHPHVVESMVRLGKKYQIDHLYKEGLRYLKLEFPKTLREYDRHNPGFYFSIIKHTEDDLALVFAVLKLALECEIQSILPALYLHTAAYRIELVMNHPEAQSLPFEVIRNIVCGREEILKAWMEQAHRLVDGDSNHLVPNGDCTSYSHCNEMSNELHKVFTQRRPNLSAVFLEWDTLAVSWDELQRATAHCEDGFCKACLFRMQMGHDLGTRYILWEKLPSYFKLPAWDKLKDMEA